MVYYAGHGFEIGGVNYLVPVDAKLAVDKDAETDQHVEVRKLFDIIRDDVWSSTKHGQQPFTYGSPPGRDDFYFAGK